MKSDSRFQKDFRFERDKAEFYKGVRDGAARMVKAKHIQQFDQEFLRFTQANQSMSVLEIGCGSGIFLRYLLHKEFQFVTGVDYDENLRVSLADIVDAGYTVEFKDAETYVDENHGSLYFDRIVLFDVLEHMDLSDCVRLLRKLYGMLGEGGKILVRVPNVSPPWGLRMQFDSFDHVTPFSPGRLRELGMLAGFKVSAITGQSTGKGRKLYFQRCLHWTLSRLLPYHPTIWEAALICVYERPE